MYQVGLIHDSNDFIETANPTLTEGVKPFQERKWNSLILRRTTQPNKRRKVNESNEWRSVLDALCTTLESLGDADHEHEIQDVFAVLMNDLEQSDQARSGLSRSSSDTYVVPWLLQGFESQRCIPRIPYPRIQA
jgi:hypothetical protein